MPVPLKKISACGDSLWQVACSFRLHSLKDGSVPGTRSLLAELPGPDLGLAPRSIQPNAPKELLIDNRCGLSCAGQ
jgi:hypothetical protein